MPLAIDNGSPPMNRFHAVLLTIIAVACPFASANEIDFVEDFALADDREAVLARLIPGTEDYYYYHCIHHQNTGELDKVDPVLEAWIKRHGHTARVEEIRNRQALLTYDQDPTASLEFIRWRLGVNFNHQREELDRKLELPTQLDPALISRSQMTQRALRHHRNTQGFEDRALDWLIDTDLDADRRRHLLERLKRPDYANLPKLIVADMRQKHSRGFGSFDIHRLLLLDQLEECVRLYPELLNQSNFVNVYLSKLRPRPGEDWRHDPEAERAYLDRLWTFAKRLQPVHNSLKANILYHRLVFDRSHGVYDHDRFMTYIKLPRPALYMNPRFMQSESSRRHTANLGASFAPHCELPPIGNDEALVRSFLSQFFVKTRDAKPYEPYIRDTYLNELFAETKIVHGLGDMEQWYSMLPPARYQALKDRVDIDFAHDNPKLFGSDHRVALDVQVKNVKTLIVKIYQINALNYYLDAKQEVGTDINLDGLQANWELTFEYDEPELRRVRRTYEFPQLRSRGTYVVDFIGNGKSSRALVRKGQLRFVSRIGAAGHVFRIFNETSEPSPEAVLHLAGHKYTPDEDGAITVPFTNTPGAQQVILADGDFACLRKFVHVAEDYQLPAGFHVDREALLSGRKAQVIVRPALRVSGRPAALKLLEDTTLTITSVDHDGVSTASEVDAFELREDGESVHEFAVPDRLSRIHFALRAKVQHLSSHQKIDLSAAASFSVNAIDRTEKTEDLHVVHADGRHALDLLGRTGEAKPDRPVNFELKHRDFRETIHVTLKTNARGRVELGELTDIEWCKATGPQGTEHTWRPMEDRYSYRAARHGLAGEPIQIPYLGTRDRPSRDEISLLELRHGTFVSDRFDALSIEDGYLVVDDLPPGNYDLLLKRQGQRTIIRLEAGRFDRGSVLGRGRDLQVHLTQPAHVVRTGADDDTIRIQLAHAGPRTRVHVAATRYLPAFSVFDNLLQPPASGPRGSAVPIAESHYVAGRNIGDELRYVLERQYATKYPGNMLDRPELLLNPWAIRKTQAERQEAAAGEAFDRLESVVAAASEAESAPGVPPAQDEDFASLDFLAESVVLLTNLVPDEDGVVTINREQLGDRHHVHIAAIDPDSTVYRSLALPEADTQTIDLRLARGLDTARHFTQQKQISVVGRDDQLVLPDIATSQFETYDSLARVYALYATLNPSSTLQEFGFVARWLELEPQKKRSLYSKYACHELSFFIYHRDRPFFDDVVRPYLTNKKDKTFLDHWLLDADLDHYLDPWSHGQLNVVERILLAQRIRGEEPRTARHVQDLYDLLPPDIERYNRLFDTALRGRGLEIAQAGAAVAVLGTEVRRLRSLGYLADSDSAYAGDAPAMDRLGVAGTAVRGLRRKSREKGAEAVRLGAVNGVVAADAAYFADDEVRRRRARQFYRKLEKTQEWVENNYYQLPIEKQNAELVTVNAFWADYAAHTDDTPFLSANLAEASRSFTEIMLAMSVLDLPFKSAEHETQVDRPQYTIHAGSPMVVFHQEIRPAEPADHKIPILVSQNYFRHGDRYRYENNQRHDKYVTDEFIVHTVYGCQVVITNPSSSPHKLSVLLQVPTGAIPVLNGQYTRSVHLDLEPYHTQTIEYYFYFPAPGQSAHYPVHVARHEQLVAFAEPATLNVLARPSRIDTESWDYISQHGSAEQVVAYLTDHNLGRIALNRIAWRMQDRDFFVRMTALLRQRHVFEPTLWSYALKHNHPPTLREYLRHADAIVNQSGRYIDCTLITIDPVERKSYQHMEYSPLVNARAHRLGARRQILNRRMYEQYHRLMWILAFRPALDDDDRMAVTYYMLLQDRIEEAMSFFDRVDTDKLATQLQHDYFRAYVDFFTDEHELARSIAEQYEDYPVERWRNRFVNMIKQLDEIEGQATAVVDDKDRTQVQTDLAATAPGLEFSVDGTTVAVRHQNLAQCRVNYYPMDIELLFSRQPFMQEYSRQFAYVRPQLTQTIDLLTDQPETHFELPAEFRNKNVVIEIIGGPVTRSQAYLSNDLTVQIIESYGQVQVMRRETGKPSSKAYVKVYARMKDGSVRFYKDGYTDLRGRFDYTSLNTNELDSVDRFSMLILSDADGATVREAAPPKR